ncbi:hypothetical protein ACIBG6_38020 [Streptomyces sp. NPDC050842]|uniref:hypothetical protein n=1 Tax=Streptomyces sp. NPDC050842 TaxID=3365636 RepID=UPI0037A79B10
MELLIAAVLVVLVPMTDKLIKIMQDRNHTRGEAEVIHAHALADLARAHGEAEIIRAHGEAEIIRAQATLPTARTAPNKGVGRA